MTYKDVYDKFMIEYDKADISSSYPSLTIYEVATLLDKAMLALIAQKVTGNNPRKSVLDIDTKSAMDLYPLFTRVKLDSDSLDQYQFENEYYTDINGITDMLYLLKIYVKIVLNGETFTKTKNNTLNDVVTIIPISISDKFKKTRTNIPWMKHPVGYCEDGYLYIYLDSDIASKVQNTNDITVYISYIKCPDKFVDKLTSDTGKTNNFILSDTMCEELINLAIIFACRNVENPRIATEIQTKSLEA